MNSVLKFDCIQGWQFASPGVIIIFWEESNMKNFTRVLAFILCLILMLSVFAACAPADDDTGDDADDANTGDDANTCLLYTSRCV